jgi:hypothetical protein
VDNERLFPGLMLGLAGYGLHFLRLSYPDLVPSPLMLDSYAGIPADPAKKAVVVATTAVG